MEMDYRLDFYNAVEAFKNEMKDGDALFIISGNHNEGDILLGIAGDVNFFSAILSNPDDFIRIKDQEQETNHKLTKNAVLNMAINILNHDDNLRKNFTKALTGMNKIKDSK